MFIFFSGRCRKPKTIDITSTVGSPSQRDGRCDVLHGAEDGSTGRRVGEAVEDGVAGG